MARRFVMSLSLENHCSRCIIWTATDDAKEMIATDTAERPTYAAFARLLREDDAKSWDFPSQTGANGGYFESDLAEPGNRRVTPTAADVGIAAPRESAWDCPIKICRRGVSSAARFASVGCSPKPKQKRTADPGKSAANGG